MFFESGKEKKNILDQVKSKGWFQYRKFHIHGGMLRFGIIAIKPESYKLKNDQYIIQDDNDSLPTEVCINSRTLKIYRISTESIEKCGQKKDLDHLPIYKKNYIKKPEQLIEMLISYIKENTSFKKASYLKTIAFVNPNRKGEIFLPCHISDSANFYVFPWLSANNLKFTGFNTFVTAGCMFGSSLKGIDDLSFETALIKHDIKFHNPKQKFLQIYLDEKDANLYETATLQDLKKLTHLIKATSTNNIDSKLVYHLPYYDYLLFGIKLFIQNKITLDALAEYFEIVVKKAFQLTGKIKEICEAQKIIVKVISPFETIFTNLMQFHEKPPETSGFIKNVFKILEIPFKNDYPEKLQDSNEAEEQIVGKCIDLLQKNSPSSNENEVWKDFIDFSLKEKEKEKDQKLCFEDLFGMGNSFGVALASYKEKDNKVCSFLPLSEKQIQVNYERFYKHNKKEKKYSPVFNLTYIDSVLGYSLFTKSQKREGLMFYFWHNTDSLFSKKSDLFEISNNNIGLFSDMIDVKSDIVNSKKLQI